MSNDDIVRWLAYDGDKLVLVNEDQDWLVYDGHEFVPIADSSKIPHTSSSTDAIALNDTVIAFTTSTGKLVFYNLQTGESDVVSVRNAFLPAVAARDDGIVLTVDDVSFQAMKWPADWRSTLPGSRLAGNRQRYDRRCR